MRVLMLAWAAFFLTSGVAFADSRHFEATHCEFHIEKMRLQENSYQTLAANLYIKVALPHLDGPVKEVGFRTQAHVKRGQGDLLAEEWRNLPAARVNPFGDNDQWRLTLLLKAGNLSAIYEGAFYLLTERGTWYWLHPMNDGRDNFWVTTDTFTFENELALHELWVNDFERLRSFNPKRCQ